MKRIFWVILGILLISASSDAHRPRGVQFGLFYNSLSDHGEWIDVSFGTAWRPHHVSNSWRPYMRGRWIWTDYGWYWSSYEPFGWATYHYGRWIYDDYYGWIWVPDDVWGPAWVEWRYDNDYIGWAPLPPYATFNVSIGLSYGHHWAAPVHYWNFVPCANFSSVQVVNYVQPIDVSRRIFGRTRQGEHVRYVDRRVYNDGPGLDRIERGTRERIRKVDVVDRDGPGEDRFTKRSGRERLEVYRPAPDEVRRDRGGRDARTSPPAAIERRERRPDVMQRERGQSPQGLDRGRSETGRDRPNGRESRPEVRRERPNGQESRPEVRRERPKGQESRPEIRRDRVDRSGQRPQEMNRGRQEQRRPETFRERQQAPQRQQMERSKSTQRERPQIQRERPSGGRQKSDGGSNRGGNRGSGRKGRDN